MKKICHTYYEPIDAIERDKERKGSQLELISICKQSWERYGWDFVVLSEKDAQSHPFYLDYKNSIAQLPSVNPYPYDYHCFMRWLAMAESGGGLMIDYDVVNHEFKEITVFNQKKLTVYQGHVPCVVYGTKDQYLEVCKKFAHLKNNKDCFVIKNGKVHCSDMIMLANGFTSSDFTQLQHVSFYPESASLVHCSSAACKKSEKAKSEAMTEVLNRKQI